MPPIPHFNCASKSRDEPYGLGSSAGDSQAVPTSLLALALVMGTAVLQSRPQWRQPIRQFRVALEIKACIVALSLAALAGCANPYALNIAELDYSAKQKSGVIQFSDPKLYPREHLINERREEVIFLKTQLTECEMTSIEPEIIRELEVVQAIAAGVGLEFDPTAALNFKSSTEISDLRNDITRVRLEMQLLQLRQDAQLLRQELDTQQADTNALPPSPGSESDANVPPPSPGSESIAIVGNAVSTPSKTEIETLLGEVGELVNNLQIDARANVTELTKKGGKAGPIDTFNYRRACRDTVKNVINQTRLDELHDLDGNALVRIQTRATLLPVGGEYNDTLGILRMEVVPPDLNDGHILGDVYHNWLGYINRNINILSDPNTSPRINTEPRFLPLSWYFQLKLLEFPRRTKDGKLVDDSAKSCSGLQSMEKDLTNCWYVRVALPSVTANDIGNLDQTVTNSFISKLTDSAVITQILSQSYTNETNYCDINQIFKTEAHKNVYNSVQQIRQFLPIALTTYLALQNSFNDSETARKLMSDLRQYIDEPWLLQASDAANKFLDAVASKNENCRVTLFEQAFGPPPDAFKNALKNATKRVSIYDVAPAERVQPVSTASRAAEAVSLAASIAGTLPNYGLGTSGNFAFTRSAIGKADALELAPIVVGFAEPKSNQNKERAAFGWLLGPKAVLKPSEKKLVFVHPVKPYELHADLSLPAWWPEFKLKTYTAWAPNWRSASTTGKTMVTTNEVLMREVTVPMRRNSGDMDGLTKVLLNASRATALLGIPRIVGVEPSEISPCDGTVHFQIWGENIWRTSMVHLGGDFVDSRSTSSGNGSAAIKVLPDMRGIVASIDISNLPIRRGSKATLTVWTPDGHDTKQIPFVERLKGNSCKRSEPMP